MKKIIFATIFLLCCLATYSEKQETDFVDWQGNIVGEAIPKWVWQIINNKDKIEIKKSLNISSDYEIWTFKHFGYDLDALKIEAASNAIVKNNGIAITGAMQEKTYWLQDENGKYLYIVVIKKHVSSQSPVERGNGRFPSHRAE